MDAGKVSTRLRCHSCRLEPFVLTKIKDEILSYAGHSQPEWGKCCCKFQTCLTGIICEGVSIHVLAGWLLCCPGHQEMVNGFLNTQRVGPLSFCLRAYSCRQTWDQLAAASTTHTHSHTPTPTLSLCLSLHIPVSTQRVAGLLHDVFAFQFHC